MGGRRPPDGLKRPSRDGAAMKPEKEPLARGVVALASGASRPELPALQKECISMLRALQIEAASSTAIPPDADFVLVLLDEKAEADRIALPDLKDRAASAVAVSEDAAEARVRLAHTRKRLRAYGAALGARELVFAPSDFGYLGLESDGRRERLEELLRALAYDAERLRLKREGWEEPVE